MKMGEGGKRTGKFAYILVHFRIRSRTEDDLIIREVGQKGAQYFLCVQSYPVATMLSCQVSCHWRIADGISLNA